MIPGLVAESAVLVGVTCRVSSDQSLLENGPFRVS